jgi:TolB protein
MRKKHISLEFCWLIILLGACSVNLPKSPPQSGILFVSNLDGNQEIYRIQPDGSERTRLTNHPAVDSDPSWSPDGTQIAFRSRRDGSSDIFIMGADGNRPFNLVNDPEDSFLDEFAPKWNPDGSILAIYTDRFQPPIGNCRQGSLGVHHLGFISLDNPDYFGNPSIVKHFDDWPGEQQTLGWAADGASLAFSSICNQENLQIFTWDRNTRSVSPLTGENYSASTPTFSPDGRFLAFSSARDGPVDVYMIALETGEIRNLTNSPSMDRQPTWSPDSSFIAFTTDRDGNNEIYITDLKGENLQNLTQNPADDILPAWSPFVP